MFFSLILIVTGIVFLLQNLGYISEGAWSIIWPVISILIGISILVKRKDSGFFWEERFWWGKKEIKEK